ncbi:hypothetical protein POTOM_041922 [Populus tomentosa]|uniref:Uncharacterized protein n=1 Tax=Populus tomentosa TaxID=118781 RepID=A0A8X7YPZ6_POPTO|nr:hypothetical protein POTOM_041922 [Populus tomentosa]
MEVLATKHEMILAVKVLGGRMGTIHLGMFFFFFLTPVYCSSILYVEGNLETKVFTDPITGLVRRIREIAVRQNGTFISVRYSLCSQPLSTRLESVRLTLFLDFAGRLVFLGKGANDQQASSSELKGLGYY